MLRGENMRFRPAIFIWFVFTQSFFEFHKNNDNRKLKAWYFRLWKNNFYRLYNERARAHQSSITFFLIHPVYFVITAPNVLLFNSALFGKRDYSIAEIK